MNDGIEMNLEEFIKLCKNLGYVPSPDRIEYAKKNQTNVSCERGVWYPLKNRFYYWNVTPSSEDKGYCDY